MKKKCTKILLSNKKREKRKNLLKFNEGMWIVKVNIKWIWCVVWNERKYYLWHRLFFLYSHRSRNFRTNPRSLLRKIFLVFFYNVFWLEKKNTRILNIKLKHKFQEIKRKNGKNTSTLYLNPIMPRFERFHSLRRSVSY